MFEGAKLRYRQPPPTLQIWFQDRPVAELSRVQEGLQRVYVFRYLPAFSEMKLAPLPGLSLEQQQHRSSELWPYFSERIPDVRRPEVAEFMRVNKIGTYDDLKLLAALGAHSVTDPFEIRVVAA